METFETGSGKGNHRFRPRRVGTARVVLLLVAVMAATSGLVASAPREAAAGGASRAAACDAACQQDLERAQAATARYQDVRMAVLDGFAPTARCVEGEGDGREAPEGNRGGMGEHFLNLPRFADSRLDVTQPEVLVYVPQGPSGRRLVAVEYSVPVMQDGLPYFGEQVPTRAESPTLFGQRFWLAKHSPVQPWAWELHAWLWQDNPDGVFAPFNPTVSCS